MSKPYAIFGAGLSALAARRLALSQGHAVVLFDEAGRGGRTTFEEGDLALYACFIFSPGFAMEHPWRLLVEASGLPCMSELAFAALHWRGQIVGITGTNGKSTLTDLIDQALRLSGAVSVAAGNIGYPLSDAVLSDANQPGAYAVVEISSFQAELADGLRLDALLWTNFAEDHLDRYPIILDYFEAKVRLFDCLKPDGLCVIGSQVAGWMSTFRREFDACTFVDATASTVLELAAESVFRCFPNTENFSLAAEFWWQLGLPFEPLIQAANEFALAAHRLSVVAECDGVRFWNDSKATNFHATLAALESVHRPVIWIGGGRAKGGDVETFAQDVAGRVDAAVLYGEVAPRLADALTGFLAVVHQHDRLEDAILASAQLAVGMPNANVLLSPGFASFDQFSSYEARGKSFNETVFSLKSTRKPS